MDPGGVIEIACDLALGIDGLGVGAITTGTRWIEYGDGAVGFPKIATVAGSVEVKPSDLAPRVNSWCERPIAEPFAVFGIKARIAAVAYELQQTNKKLDLVVQELRAIRAEASGSSSKALNRPAE